MPDRPTALGARSRTSSATKVVIHRSCVTRCSTASRISGGVTRKSVAELALET